MGKPNQKGFAAVEIILALVLLIGIVVIGYAVWKTNKANNKADHTVTSASQQSTANRQSPKNQQPSQKYLVIKEWGVKMPLSSSISDAYYVYKAAVNGDGYGNIYLGTKSLTAVDSGCAAEAGAFSRETIKVHDENAAQTPEWDRPVYGTKIGDYYYGYNSPQAACSDKTSVQQEQQTIMKAFATAASKVQPLQ